MNPIDSLRSDVARERRKLVIEEQFINLCEKYNLYTHRNGITIIVGEHIESIIPLLYLDGNSKPDGHKFGLSGERNSFGSDYIRTGNTIDEGFNHDFENTSVRWFQFGISYLFYPEHKLHYKVINKFVEEIIERQQIMAKTQATGIYQIADNARRTNILLEYIILTQSNDVLSAFAYAKGNEIVRVLYLHKEGDTFSFIEWDHKELLIAISRHIEFR